MTGLRQDDRINIPIRLVQTEISWQHLNVKYSNWFWPIRSLRPPFFCSQDCPDDCYTESERTAAVQYVALVQ